jgi:formate dehydrogenase major subunit
VGLAGDSSSIADIEKADLVLIIGSNSAESHPVIATRVKSSHKLDGQKLIVSDLRENEMARRADLFPHPNPGADLWCSARSIAICWTKDLPIPSFWMNG